MRRAGKGYGAEFAAALRGAKGVGWLETQGFTLGYFRILPPGGDEQPCGYSGRPPKNPGLGIFFHLAVGN
jgi:hypothetical protein